MKLQISFLILAVLFGVIGWLGLGPDELNWLSRPVSVLLFAAFLISHFMGRQVKKFNAEHPNEAQ